MNLKGDIANIRFRNDDNGFTILTLDTKGENVTVAGSFPPVTEGEHVSLEGRFTMHPKYGRQFSVESVRVSMPQSLDSIARFLGSRIIKGIGPKTALAIVSKFGKDTLTVIEFTPQKLSMIKGISEKKALEMGEGYRAIKNMRDVIIFLQGLGVGLNLALRIYKKFGGDSVSIVRTNPYLLVEHVERVGFVTADKIALKYGIPMDSAFRVRAGIIYTLKESSDRNGNTYLPKPNLISASLDLLGVETELIENCIDELIFDQKLKRVNNGELEGIMHIGAYLAEKAAATKLVQIHREKNRVLIDPTSLIKQFEKIEGIELHQKQRNAIMAAVSGGVSIITGGPGTGKTTIVKCVTFILNAWKKTSMLMAPTGRAAKRLSEQTGEDASTIHRALINKSAAKEHFEANTIIVDEVSMVDVFLLHSLLSALKPDTSIILVGDKDQLPSVGAGNVLADILKADIFSVSYLERVYRQGEESLIVENAHLINAGEMPYLESKDRDFFFIEAHSPLEIAGTTVDLVVRRLPKYLDCEAKKIQVLAPLKNGDAGTLALNQTLAEQINPNRFQSLQSESYKFKQGDKVMHIANNYDLEWSRYSGRVFEEGKGIFNGDLGFIEKIDKETAELTVRFEDERIAIYTRDIHSQLVLSYAITIHKSQGCEFDCVVIPIVPGNFMILTRNLLYTAITRGKKLVVLVGGRGAIKKVVDNNFIQKRYSYLFEFMQEANKKTALLEG